VGFGISNGRQAREAAASADAVVVGSALVQAARAGTLASLVRELAEAVHGKSAKT
jgi:tryptophan synthase alpha chain